MVVTDQAARALVVARPGCHRNTGQFAAMVIPDRARRLALVILTTVVGRSGSEALPGSCYPRSRSGQCRRVPLTSVAFRESRDGAGSPLVFDERASTARDLDPPLG